MLLYSNQSSLDQIMNFFFYKSSVAKLYQTKAKHTKKQMKLRYTALLSLLLKDAVAEKTQTTATNEWIPNGWPEGPAHSVYSVEDYKDRDDCLRLVKEKHPAAQGVTYQDYAGQTQCWVQANFLYMEYDPESTQIVYSTLAFDKSNPKDENVGPGSGYNESPDYVPNWTCGKAPIREQDENDEDARQNRIVNGKQATPGYYPWVVGVGVLSRPEYETFKCNCGGTIVSAKFILSAAHCYYDENHDENHWVYAGMHNTDSRSGNEQIIKTKKVTIHPQYDDDTTDWDFAMLELSENLKFTDYVQPACINRKYDPFEGETNYLNTGNKDDAVGTTDLYVAGWGSLYRYMGVSPNILQFLLTHPNDINYCNARYSYELTDRQLCAGTNTLEKTCSGDSGGGLFLNDNGDWTIVAIVSFAHGCNNRDPDVYAKVFSATKWIDTFLKYEVTGIPINYIPDEVVAKLGTDAEEVSSFKCGTRPISGKNNQQQNSDRNTRIIHDRDPYSRAKAGDFPWTVAIMESLDDPIFASGALISQKYVITSNVQFESCFLAVGQDDQTFVQKQTQFFQSKKIIKKATHGNGDEYNLALIELDGLVEFSDYVQPVCVPDAGQDFGIYSETALTKPEGDKDLFITGWGYVHPRGPTANKLNYAKVKAINKEICRKWLVAYSEGGGVLDTEMCAGKEDGSADTCNQDVGSPLISKVNGAWFLHGVHSWGIWYPECGFSHFPTVYTDVSNKDGGINDWIYENSDLRNLDITFDSISGDNDAESLDQATDTVNQDQVGESHFSDALDDEAFNYSDYMDQFESSNSNCPAIKLSLTNEYDQIIIGPPSNLCLEAKGRKIVAKKCDTDKKAQKWIVHDSGVIQSHTNLLSCLAVKKNKAVFKSCDMLDLEDPNEKFKFSYQMGRLVHDKSSSFMAYSKENGVYFQGETIVFGSVE